MYLFDRATNSNGACNTFTRDLWYATATLPAPPVTATVSSINTTSSNPTNAASINYTVTFDKSISGITTANFSITSIGLTGASVASVSGSGTTRTVTVNTGTGSGTIRLNMANSTGVTPTVTNVPFTTGTTVTIDKTAPAVTSVSVPANGTYRAGQVLSFTVNFDDNVIVTGNPYLPITIGGSSVQATYNSGTGTSALGFRYTVATGQQDTDGIQVGSSIALNGGSLKDGVGNDATLTLNSVASTVGVKVDAVAPTVTISSSAGASGSTTGTSPIPFTFTFSENVSGFVIGDVTVSGGTPSGFSGSGTTYSFNVTPAGNGLITVNVGANVAQDAAGNGNTAASQFSITYSQPVTQAPVVVTPANGSVSNINTPIYTGTAPVGSTVTVYIDLTSIGTTTATGGNWSIPQPSALAEGSHTVRATAQLSGQAVSGSSNTNNFTIDTTAPNTNITIAPTNPSSSANASYSFTGNDGSGSGIASFEASLDGGNFSPATSPITLTGLANGSHTFQVRAIDRAGNIDPTPASYTWVVDTTPPTVSISSSAGASGTTTGTSPISFTLVFSESVTGLTSGEITVSGGTPSGFSGSGNTYSFNVTPAGNGLITVNVGANVAQDAAGNGNTAATPFSITYSQPVTPAPLVNSPANGALITTNTPTYSGTAAAGSLVTVYVDDSSIGTTTATGGNWSILQPSALPNASHSVRATAQLSGQAVSGNSNTATFTVDISTMSLTLSANAVCANSPLSLTATAMNIGSPVTYSLSSTPAGFSGSGSSPQFLLTAPAVGSPTTYTLTVTAMSNAGNASATAVVTVNPLPTVTIVNLASSYCKNASDVVLSGTPVGGVFTVDGTTVTSFSPNSLSVGQHTVVYSYTNGTGCSATTSQAVTVNPTPTPSLVASGTLTCTQTTVTLTANGGSTYQFSGPGSINQSGNTASVNAAGVYSVTVTNNSGCFSTTTVTVSQDTNLPSVSITPSSTTLTCTNPTATLLANGSGNYLWSTGATTASISVNAAGTYSVTITSGNGCQASASTQITQDNTAPSVSITPSGATLTCTNPTATLSVNGNGTYRWNTGATTNSINASSAGTYSVTLTGANGCIASASAQVTLDNAVPPVSITPSSATLTCANPTATLTATGNGTYQWNTGANTSSISVNATGAYSVTVTGNNGCSATASAQISQDINVPSVTITPTSATLTCANPSATLVANGNGMYRWSTGETTASISVNLASTYSVTLTGSNGCAAVASVQVSQDNSISTPSLMASALTTVNQPISLTASGCSGTINWQVQGGSGQANGAIYTLSAPGTYTLTATCTVGTCTSPAAPALTLTIQSPNTNFAITSVQMVNCYKTNPSRGEYIVQFTPRYSGQNSNPISFSVVNELPATTDPAPYNLRLYDDNPVITLVANQAGNGEARYVYNWLASCSTGNSPNQPPTTVGISAQTLTLNQPYQLTLSSYFTDPEGQTLTYSAQGLPAGVAVAGNLLTGTPSQTGTFGVSITAIDPGNLSVSTSFNLTVQVQPISFAFVGVTPVSCEVLKSDQRRVRFTPQYSGLNGQPVTFRVVNELPATTQAGPYSLDLYTDNPVIELRASQAGTAGEVSFSYNWLAACGSLPPTNTAPKVTQEIPNQVGVVGQAFSYNIPANTFNDPDGDALVLTASGLPAGLSLTGSVISGTPSFSGVSTVKITATDPGNLSASTNFVLTINQVTIPPTEGFAITGVNLLTCLRVSEQQRLIRFSPQYSGLTGQPISFSVVNEMLPTTAGGPYELQLYTDNPVIVLKATQAGTVNEASFSYNWLAACGTPSGRVSAEISSEFSVEVLGNPVVGEWVEVVVKGAGQQSLRATTITEHGMAVDTWQTPSAWDEERIRMRVGATGGIYLLKVVTSSHSQTIKLIKH